MKHKNGFTLVELIIVITIMAVLSVIALPMLHAGFNSYFTQRDLNDADWQGRLALSRMTRDLQNIPNTGDITTASSTQLTFVDNTNTTVTYTIPVTSTNLQRNGLNLAQGVSALTFGYFDKNGAIAASTSAIRYIAVTLNITRNNTNITMQTVIYLRNLVA